MDRVAQEKAVAFYREEYLTKGIYDCKLYTDSLLLLEKLKENNILTSIATAKPEKSAKIVLDHLGINKYFNYVAGSNPDGSRSSKKDLIEYSLNLHPEIKKEQVCMIGDSASDGIGANEANVDFYAVLHEREKEDFSPATVKEYVATLEELIPFVL